ncbi:MAG: SUMF1/EgtB/PvdO family nonheme iron enzyme [Bacteroidaceae bacterium]|nr:SUMF1/EgtB/PvdO family nonheme iron enzyme [Bacteroidaceae bacterium]
MEGYYDLEVRLAHHQTATKQIQVIAGQPQKLTLNPIPIYGSLDITSTPYDADVTIDGKSYGKTPLTVEQLLEGKHNVVLSKDGMLSESISVVVEADKTATASATLKVKPVQQPIQQQPVQQATPSSTPSSSSTQTFTVKGVSFNMIFVEGGTFTMGATLEQGSDAWDDEKPGHQVTLSSYYIGETEVTQALWKAVMGSNPSSFKGENRPVESVSWDDCKTFIRKLNSLTGKNFRLPSEAEWEFAARGGNKSQGYKYSGSNTLGNVAWYFDNSGIETHSVKSKSPNELGIYDMSGNVWEWCQDWYGSYSSSSQTNPTGASSGSYRVSRGGGWNGDAGNCRVSLRFNFSPGHRNFYLGLRLAL